MGFLSNSIAIDPNERLIDGRVIDDDLGIVSRTRRNMVADGRLPKPAGYLGGQARWHLGAYLEARKRLLTGGPKGFGANAKAIPASTLPAANLLNGGITPARISRSRRGRK